MSNIGSSASRIKAIKVTCDRCKQILEGIQGEEFTAGFYNMAKWEEYRRNAGHIEDTIGENWI